MSLRVPAARITFDAPDRRRVASLIEEALASGALTLGPLTRQLEEGFAERHGAPHGVAVASGTAALEIVLRYVGVQGSDVVVPANTFYATAGAVMHAGASPVIADVEARTFALSRKTVEDALTENTRAVVLVHIAGIITDEVDSIRELCDARGIALVEDAAHAHGCELNGRHAGSFGVAGAFSFYPTKVMTTGEGGMILTGDSQLRDEARIYRDQGKAGFLGDDHIRMGYAWRMSELAAATGVVHLDRLDQAISVRRSVAERYDRALASLPGLQLLSPCEGGVTNYYKYVVLLPDAADRDRLKKSLREEHEVFLSGEVYATPLHHQEVLRPYAGESLPVAEDVCSRHVCLPVMSDMTDTEVDHVIESFARVYESL
ncbi:MAG TPA: DegT/DnrJ/EryC1/StrS aminotransferase family protein [Acidimicrobiales bacterium]|nr:DegT/DnrJ/EryC1/StrS aminotransferase family protein [Acidimicrobiales bacterium]